MVTAEIQAVVLAAGKGSRMLDVTGGGVKCMIPLAGLPLLYYPLKMLENNGFLNVLLTVPDSVKVEVSKFAEKYKLALKLDVVGIPVQEEWGTLDTLRHVSDKLTGSDLLIVSGDLVTSEGLQKLTDLHRGKRSGLTLLLNKPGFHLESSLVPGSSTNKYKKERDIVGLRGDAVCLFKAEADIEDEINIPKRLLNRNPRFTCHTNLHDAHLYLIKKYILDDSLNDKSMSAMKGELISKLIDSQFKSSKLDKIDSMDVDAHAHADSNTLTPDRSLSCFATVTQSATIRVNNIPSYWLANKLIKDGSLPVESDLPVAHQLAKIHEKSQMKDCTVGSKSVVSEKTSLNSCSVGSNCTIQEKVVISNCIIMDNVTIHSGVTIKDSIVCEGATLETGCELTNCIVGKQLTVNAQSCHSNQVLLDSDRMMHV